MSTIPSSKAGLVSKYDGTEGRLQIRCFSDAHQRPFDLGRFFELLSDHDSSIAASDESFIPFTITESTHSKEMQR